MDIIATGLLFVTSLAYPDLKIEHTLLEWKIEFIERLSVILRASKNKSAHSMGFSSGPTDSIV